MVKVLLVDDEPVILRLFRAVLEGQDFAVETAASATEAIERLEHERYDLIVTDLKMETPAAGFDVVRAGRRLDPRPTLVLLTAFPVPTPEWKRVGADALFVKGANVTGLPAQLKKLLNPPPEPASTETLQRCVGS